MRTVNEWIVDIVSTLLLTLSLSLTLTFLLTLLTHRVDAQTASPVTVLDTLVTSAAKEKA
jgi:hypothetical protein